MPNVSPLAPASFPAGATLKLPDGEAFLQEPDRILSPPEEEQLAASLP